MNKTVALSGRVDIIEFAVAVDYFASIGIPAQTKSDVLWKAIKMVANHAIKACDIPEYHTVEDAIHSLTVHGIDIRSNERSRRGVMNALQQETLLSDFGAQETIASTLREEYAEAVKVAEAIGVPKEHVITFEQFCKEKEKTP